jgi:alkanesulfonate monooxygenase SsuD/methylene tetrahydromethanopterin reductase-like flavin-dependent oxidoreductase (luciferase family)
MTTQFGVHLPLIDFGGAPWTVTRLVAYAREAAALGFHYLCANDHLVFRRPWLDGPTALAAVLPACADMTIATTVALPVVRGPAQTAKLLAALHALSDGRLIAGVGPGSSAADFTAAGVPFAERWTRFDEAVRVLRVLLGRDTAPFRGTFYASDSTTVEPVAGKTGAPPLWIPSWGSAVGMRRVAELGDGWLASAYNSTPAAFGQALDRLDAAGRPATTFPNALATMWLHVTDRPSDADHVIDSILAPMLNRTADDLRTRGLPIGSPEQCAERLSAYSRAGAQRIFLWPLGDEVEQLAAFRAQVMPLLSPAA